MFTYYRYIHGSLINSINMKSFIIILSILIGITHIKAQQITGKVIDNQTKEAIEYVSVGVMNTPLGAISDENGNFELDAKQINPKSRVRVSMIGYEPQQFTISELLVPELTVEMVKTSYDINAITITPTQERIIGEKGFTRSKGWSGWGGLKIRKGYELGLKLDLGDELIKIKSLHVLIHRQAFDSSYFRLHIRSVNDTNVLDELLTENIIFPITEESGWAEINLENYNLIHNGEVGVTLEWIKVSGVNADRAMKINNKMWDAYFLFKNIKNQTGLRRWGSEDKWQMKDDYGISMYLTVLE